MVASITEQSIRNPNSYHLLVTIAGSLWMRDKSTMLALVTIGYMTFCQILPLVTNTKLGHFMKIAPRTLFFLQVIACLITPSLGVGIQYYYFEQSGFITKTNTASVTGSFSTTSVGVVVDEQLKSFSLKNRKNRNLLYSLLMGSVLPIPFWYAKLRWEWCRHIHTPLILTFISWLSIVPAGSLFTWLLISLLTTGFYLSWLIITGPLAQYGVHFPTWRGTDGRNGGGCPLTLPNGIAFFVSFQH